MTAPKLKSHWSRPFSEAVARLLSVDPDLVHITVVAARQSETEISYCLEHPLYGLIDGSLTVDEMRPGTVQLFGRGQS